MRVGAALRYCSNGFLFARWLTGSYSTWTVIHTFAAPPNSISCLWRSRPLSSLAPESAWSRSGTALGSGRYFICRKLLIGAPMGWSDCQYRFGICRGCSVRIPIISIDSKGCGAGRFVSNGCGAGWCNAVWCGAGGWEKKCCAFDAMSWSSKWIICLASRCSYVGQRALYTGIRAWSSSSFFSRAWIASIRLISKVIIVSERRSSAAADYAMFCGMSVRRCTRRWSINWILLSIKII